MTAGRWVETSLGYFVNPLVSVGLGVLVLGERLRAAQKLAIGVAALAVVVLSVASGRPPWLALVLAFSFGLYGLLKKQAGVGAVASLAIETAVLSPLAAAYVVVLGITGASTFSSHGIGHASLLATAGLVTAIPLLAFGSSCSTVVVPGRWCPVSQEAEGCCSGSGSGSKWRSPHDFDDPVDEVFPDTHARPDWFQFAPARRAGRLHEHVSHRHVDRPDTPLMAHALALLTDELNVAAARLPETAGRLATTTPRPEFQR